MTARHYRRNHPDHDSGRPQKYVPGARFGMLVLLARAHDAGIFQCDCGNIFESRIHNVVYNGKSDCGCIRTKRSEDAAREYQRLRSQLNLDSTS